MTNPQTDKILIFDGISGISLAKEMSGAFAALGCNQSYLDHSALPQKKLYKLRATINKFISRQFAGAEFHYEPQLTTAGFAAKIKEEKPDIVLIIGFFYRFVSPSLVSRLQKELGFLLFLYDTDSCNLFGKRRELTYFFSRELVLYDHIFSCSRTTTDLINQAIPGRASWFPFGASPISPSFRGPKDTDIVFVGSADLRRVFLLDKIKQFNIKIYGSRFRRHDLFMSEELRGKINYQTIWGPDLHKLLQRGKIILNITRSTFYGVETGINLRIFEALSARAFLLTDYCPELCELFQAGKELETFNSSEELISKAEYYIRHDRAREKIAEQGHKKFLAEYTWEKRVADLARQMQRMQE